MLELFQPILDGIGWLQSLGSTVFMPIVIFVVALIFGAKPGKAFRAALTIGVAFIGINLVIGLMSSNIGTAAQAMASRTGVQLTTVDVGWPAAAAIAFGGTVGVWIIPLGVIVNIVMLATRTTKTLNIDIWNFWHFAFTGSMIYALTNDLALALAFAALNSAIVLWLADWTAPAIQDVYKLPNVSIPHGFSAAYVPIAIPINKLIDMIPGLNKLEADSETIQEKWGVWGEPVIQGFLIGLVIGCLAWLGDSSYGSFWDQVNGILNLSVGLAAVMVLLPRMVSLLMEGLMPVSEAAAAFMKKRSGTNDIYIGLDSAIIVGHPSAIASGLIMVPITIALAIGLSALGVNKILPFVDLAVLPFIVAMVNPVTRGNVVRNIIVSTVVIGAGLVMATSLSGLHTAAALDAGFALPEGATQISSICDGTNPLSWAIVNAGKLGWIGFAIATAVFVAIFVLYKRNEKAWQVAAGGPAELAE